MLVERARVRAELLAVVMRAALVRALVAMADSNLRLAVMAEAGVIARTARVVTRRKVVRATRRVTTELEDISSKRAPTVKTRLLATAKSRPVVTRDKINLEAIDKTHPRVTDRRLLATDKTHLRATDRTPRATDKTPLRATDRTSLPAIDKTREDRSDLESSSYRQDSSRQERSRSRSLSSGTKERRQKERQARKDAFSRENRGWDRQPTADEIETQEAERMAVRAAEAQGRDITTIRADFLKQASAAPQ